MSRHPLALLSSLYAAQGLPFGFFTLALPVLMREAGWSLTAIGLLQVLALPWLLKFLWAPWVDHSRCASHLVLGLQGGSVVAALVLALPDLRPPQPGAAAGRAGVQPAGCHAGHRDRWSGRAPVGGA